MLRQNLRYFVLLFSSFVLLIGCSRENENRNSTIKIVVPGSSGLSKTTLSNNQFGIYQSVGAQNTGSGGPDWNASLNPNTFSEVNCMVVMVSGPESDMRRNTCVRSDGTSFAVGRWAGGIPVLSSNQTASIDVPSGSGREIMVFGFKTTDINFCKNFKASEIPENLFSEPTFLGSRVQALNPGVVSVAISVASNLSSSYKISECNGPDFNFEGSQALDFGDGSNSDVTLVTNTTLTNNSVRINDVVVNSTSTWVYNSNPAYFPNGSEVALIVVAQRNSNPSISSCGNDRNGYPIFPGTFAFAKVLSVGGGYSEITKGTFIDDMDSVPGAMFINAQNTANFCAVQMLNVKQYNTLTMSTGSPGGTLSPSNYNSVTSLGGYAVIRVKDTLTINYAATHFSADIMGYTGLASVSGSGVLGENPLACGVAYSGNPDNYSNSGVCSGTFGGGGGGHGGAGGSGNIFPNSGGGKVGENDGSTFSGTMFYRMFMGGAGGSGSATAGGNGGGGFIIVANRIFLNANSIISVNGMTGAGTESGGGAGGSVFLGYKELIKNGNNLTINARGGAGGTGPDGGGGGGGGRVHIHRCVGASLPDAVDVAGGIGVNGGQSGENGSYTVTDALCN